MALVTGLVIITAVGLVGSRSAHAFAIVPSFEAVPAIGVLGMPYSIDVTWPSVEGAPPLKGCPNSVDFAVFGPGADPVDGDYGPEIDSGTLAADTYAADGSVTSYGTATVTPTQLGTYTIIADPNGENLLCDGSTIFAGSFNVTAPVAPPNTLKVTPTNQSQSIDNSATVTATLDDGTTGQPISGTGLSFALAGPNSAVGGVCVPASCVTDSSGHVTWTYAGKTTGHDTVNVQVGPQGGGGVLGQATVDWTPTINGDAFAALGDSFSAGEGTQAYIAGTNTPGVNMCHRSVLAYGPLLDNGYSLGSLGFAACSGAVTDDLFEANHALNEGPDGTIEPAQLCRTVAVGTVTACGSDRLPVVGPDTKRVTLTIGGNDAGFVTVAKSCVWASIGPGNKGFPGRGCSLTPSVFGPAYKRLAALAGGATQTSPDGTVIHSLLSTLKAIHTAAPNAHGYIAGYPRLFQDTTGKDCTVGEVFAPGGLLFDLRIAPLDAAWLDLAATTLNTEIAAAVASAGKWATYVNVANRFAGHGICSASPWLNPITATLSVSLTAATAVDFTTLPGSLHPTLQGQASGYEPAFVAAGATG